MLTLEPPSRKQGGRPLGSANSVNADVRGMVLIALHKVGGVKYLAQQAIDHPATFMALLAKVMPTSIVSPPGTHLHLHLEAAMQISKQMQAEPRPTITIEQQAQAAPPASLLDAPLPEE